MGDNAGEKKVKSVSSSKKMINSRKVKSGFQGKEGPELRPIRRGKRAGGNSKSKKKDAVFSGHGKRLGSFSASCRGQSKRGTLGLLELVRDKGTKRQKRDGI